MLLEIAIRSLLSILGVVCIVLDIPLWPHSTVAIYTFNHYFWSSCVIVLLLNWEVTLYKYCKSYHSIIWLVLVWSVRAFAICYLATFRL